MASPKIDAPLFTVITVCRNAEALIAQTVTSLVNQTFKRFEHLVIDGASSDKTLDIIRQLAPALSLRIVSEPDNGIYDAMNKGIRLARGQWIYFLNAGDDFVDNDVLQRIALHLQSHSESDVVFGDVIYRGETGQRLVRFDWLTKSNLLYESLCHQAVFAKRAAFERYGLFDTQYRINADYDWLLNVFSNSGSVAYLGLPIAYYDDAGLSARQHVAMKAERALVRDKYLPKGSGRLLQLGYRACRKLLRMAGLSKR